MCWWVYLELRQPLWYLCRAYWWLHHVWVINENVHLMQRIVLFGEWWFMRPVRIIINLCVSLPATLLLNKQQRMQSLWGRNQLMHRMWTKLPLWRMPWNNLHKMLREPLRKCPSHMYLVLHLAWLRPANMPNIIPYLYSLCDGGILRRWRVLQLFWGFVGLFNL